MTCHTFSVKPTIPESKNVIVMKKIDEICEEEYFDFEELSFGEEKTRLKSFYAR